MSLRALIINPGVQGPQPLVLFLPFSRKGEPRPGRTRGPLFFPEIGKPGFRGGPAGRTAAPETTTTGAGQATGGARGPGGGEDPKPHGGAGGHR